MVPGLSQREAYDWGPRLPTLCWNPKRPGVLAQGAVSQLPRRNRNEDRLI